MVVWTYTTYSLASWLISVVMGVLKGIIRRILLKNLYLFVADRILSINRCDYDGESSIIKASADNSSNNTEQEKNRSQAT
jgi:hypothetical protein